MSFVDDYFGSQSQPGGIPAPYKTSDEARKDVAAAVPRDGSSWVDDMFGAAPLAVTQPKPDPAPDQGNFGRGWGIAGKQLKQTAYGTAALIGDTFGSDDLKKWGLQGYKDAEKEIQAVSKESDSFTSAVQSGDVGSWLTYSAGYLAGQFAELGVASAAGAVVGGAMSGPALPAGAAAGAVTGAINKAAVQTGLRAAVGKLIDKEAASLTAAYIERGMVKEAAEKAAAEQAVKSVYRTIGATTANTFLNATQELGSIYGEAVDEAAKSGQEYSLGKIWLSGVAATAVDTWADSRAVKGMTDAFKGKSRVSSIAMEAFKGGMREGLTEGTQTVIERWGADKDLTSKEAFKEYIDSAAVGVLGGTAVGSASGAVSKLQASTGATETDQTQPNLTKLPESQSGRTRPLDDADTPGMPRDEVRETLSNPGFVAALYQQSSDIDKKILRSAVERAGLQESFQSALSDPDQIAYGAKMIQNSPDFVSTFMKGAEEFATTQSPAGVYKADFRGSSQSATQDNWSDERFAQEGYTLKERPAGTAPTRPTGPDLTPQTTETRVTNDQEKQRPVIENRDELISKFNDIGNQIFEGEMTAPKEARYDWAMKQLIASGFDSKDARSILIGETTVSVPEQAAPDLSQQGALEEAVQAAEAPAVEAQAVEAQADPNAPLFSKTSDGAIKAVFVPEARTVFYSKAARALNPDQLYALYLHEAGAHYGFQRMVGEQRYKEILSELESLRSKDAVIAKAFDSVPSDTKADLVSSEALGYLVENHQNLGIVQKFLQAIRDWYAKTFKGQTLTSTQLTKMAKAALSQYGHEVRKVQLTEDFSSTPEPGLKKVDFQSALNGNRQAHEFMDFMSEFGDSVSLTGSLAISPQADIYRPPGEQVHDLDFMVKDMETARKVLEGIRDRFKNSSLTRTFTSKKASSETIQLVVDSTAKVPLHIDLFVPLQDAPSERSAFQHSYTGADGKQHTIGLKDYRDTFAAKFKFSRAKDVNDALRSGKFDLLFSKASPSEAALPDAIKAVMTKLRSEGVDSYQEASKSVMNRMRANKDWAPLADKVDQGMLLKAWNAAGGGAASSGQNVVSFPQERTRKTVRQLIIGDLQTENESQFEAEVERAKSEVERAKRVGGGRIDALVKQATSMPPGMFEDTDVFQNLSPFERSAFLSVMNAEQDLADAQRALNDFKKDTYGKPSEQTSSRTGVRLTGSSPYLAKDQRKADKANKFIGRGSDRSSTAQYARDFGALANSGSYDASDTVFVSAEGARGGRVEPDFAEIKDAVTAGATILTDDAFNRNRPYNIGERQVADFLSSNGYAEAEPGVWKAKKVVARADERPEFVGPQEQEQSRPTGDYRRNIDAEDDDGVTFERKTSKGKKQPAAQSVRKAPEGPTATLRTQTRAVKTGKGDLLITNQNPINARSLYMSPEEVAENERRAEEAKSGDDAESRGEKTPEADDFYDATLRPFDPNKPGKGKSSPSASYYRQGLREAVDLLNGRVAMISLSSGERPAPTKLNRFLLEGMGFDIFKVKVTDDKSGAVGRRLKEIEKEMNRNASAAKKRGATVNEKTSTEVMAQLPLGMRNPNIGPAESEPIRKLRESIDSKIRLITNASYYEDSVRSLQAQIADVEQRLKDLSETSDSEEFFKARRNEDSNPGMWGQQDENAYDRFEGGMIYDKASPKNELLERRRKLTDDLEAVRSGSHRGQARLYRLGMNRLYSYIRRVRDYAIRSGLDPAEVQRMIEPYEQGIAALAAMKKFRISMDAESGSRRAQMDERRMQGLDGRVDPDVDPALEEANRNLAQKDFLEGERVAMGLLADFRARKMTQRELEALEMRGLREGDFTLTDLFRAYEAFGISPRQRLYGAMKHFSMRTRLKDYVAQSGGRSSAVDAYFEDMLSVKRLVKPEEFSRLYGAQEQNQLVLWQDYRSKVLARRHITPVMRDLTNKDPRKVFDGFLFTRITLEEARNPDTIQSPTLRLTYKSLFDNLEEAWFSDLAAALRLRPDLESALFNPDPKFFYQQSLAERLEAAKNMKEGDLLPTPTAAVSSEPVISPQERAAFQQWVDRIKAGIQKQALVMARAPYFAALRNDPMLDAVTTPEGYPMVASTPKVDVDQTGLSADLESQDSRDVRRAEYEVLYAKVVAGELEAVREVLEFNARQKAMRDKSFNEETGEIELASDALGSILMNAQMVEPDRSNYGRRIDGDSKVVRTIEEAADRDAQIGQQTDASLDDLSSDEQIQEEVISEFDGETQEAADEYSEADEGQGADEGPAAEQEQETPAKRGGRVPKSLVPGMEYRFRRGKAWDVFSMTAVQDIVNRLTAGWKNAANVVVLPNAQHLPEPLRSRVIVKLAGSGAKGLYHDGNVYLFSQHLSGEADVEFTLFHESYGHLGMRAVLGEKFDQFLETAYRTRPEVRQAADDLIADGMPKLEAIDEVLSDMAAENRNVSIAKQWVGKIISGLREIGLNRVADWFATMTDAEVSSTLAAARDAVRNGTLPAMNGAPSEVRFKEAKPPYEVFATKDGKTTGYARYNPVTDSWAVFSADGADIRDGYTTTTTQDFDTVVQAMKHRGKVEYRLRSGLYVDDKIVADLVTIPKFNDTKKYPIRPFAQSWATNYENAKKRWAQIRRNAQIQFQNEYLPVFEVVEYLESKGRLTPNIDVKTALMLYERRAGYLVEQFRKRYAEPIQKLLEQAGRLGVTKKDVDRYLTARHAFERNAVIASINPQMKDGGSGLSNKDAAAILRSVNASPAAQVLEEIGRLTDKMGRAKVDYLQQTGMITKKLAEKLRQYNHYVNLSGEAGADPDMDDPGMLAGGSKFNVKGKERRALGRGEGNEATDVLARTIQGFEAALIRGQKNLVAQKVLGLIETNYSPEFAIVNAQPRKRQFNPEIGEVEEVIDENYMARKDVMVAKVGGIPTTIEFKEAGLGSFADAIHGMVSPAQSSAFMEGVGKVSRFLGSLLTTYNPAFTLVNGFRDVQTMYLNAAADGKISQRMARDMIKALPTALRAAIHEASGGRLGRGANPETLRVLREMQREGGITYFADRKNLEDQVQKLDDLLSGKRYPMQETFQKIGSVMEFLADVSEIAPRLAAYKVVRENGFSTEQAAVFSGDITVNFNMRGANKDVRQLYVFFNPAVQGSYKLYKLASTKEGQKQFAKIAFALTTFGFLTSLLGRAVSGEDDDGIDRLDKVPVYKRATSVVVSADSFWGAPLPIPYGWNAFFATGVFMADTVMGKQPMSVSAKRIALTTAEAFSPIGTGAMDAKSPETFLAKFVSPTALLPGVEFLANESRFGAPIRKEQSPFDASKTPDAQQYFRGVSPISRTITDGLTDLTGGNKYKAGGIDVNPATIDFLIQSYLPGLPSDVYKGAGVAIRASQGEDVKRVPWPIADRFSARIPTGYDAGAYRRAAEMVETVYQEYDKTRDQGRRQEIRAEYPRLGYAHAVIASTTQELRQVRKQLAELEARPMSDEVRVRRKNQLMDREEAIFKRATSRLMQAGDPVREAMMANE